jgi:transmembrane sensor
MEKVMKGKEYLNLGIKSLTGELDKDEEKIFENWLTDSELNRKEYDSMKAFWNKTQPADELALPDVEADWEALDRRIRNDERQKQNSEKTDYLKSFTSFIFLPKLRPVTAAIALALIVVINMLIFTREEVRANKVTVQTLFQEHKTINLPDGSTVTLNNNSTLDYPNVFLDKTREVTLNGEAYFSIKKDGRPFIIKTSNATTTVLGTKFNIWSRDERTRVSVNEGKVKVAGQKNMDVVYLTRNQQSIVVEKSGPTEPTRVDSDFLVEWLNNKLVFSGSALADVVEELQRYYSKKIVIEGSKLPAYNLTGSFRNRDVDSVLTMICLALDVSYTKDEEGYVIKLRE